MGAQPRAVSAINTARYVCLSCFPRRFRFFEIHAPTLPSVMLGVGLAAREDLVDRLELFVTEFDL